MGLADITIEAQVDGVVVIARARGAGPLITDAPIQIDIFERVGNGQDEALHLNIVCRLAQLSGRQSENSPIQSSHIPVAVAGGVADFGGADERADSGVQHVFVGAVKPAIQAAVVVGIHIAASPVPNVIAVLSDYQRPPGPI